MAFIVISYGLSKDYCPTLRHLRAFFCCFELHGFRRDMMGIVRSICGSSQQLNSKRITTLRLTFSQDISSVGIRTLVLVRLVNLSFLLARPGAQVEAGILFRILQ